MDKYNVEDLNKETFKVPPIIPPTTNQDVTSAVNSLTMGLQAEQKETQKTAKDQESDIVRLLGQIGSEGQMKEDIYQELGGDEAKKQSTELLNQIEAEKLSARRKIENIVRNNPEGALRAGQQDIVNNIERESLTKQADLAIVQQMYEGRYKNAEDIAARKVSLLLEPLKTELEQRQFLFENAKDRLNKTEQKLWDLNIKELDRKIKRQEEDYTESSKMIMNAIQSNAPQMMISKAQELLNTGKSATEVARVLGNYSLSLADRLENQLKQKQLAKLEQELTTKNTDVGELVKIGGKDYIRYKDGTISDPVLPEATDDKMVVERITDKISGIDELLANKIGLRESAGAVRSIVKLPGTINKINDWRAGLINITQKLTVDELGRIKSDGVTFGQLSNGERLAVGEAATKLNSSMIRKGSGEDARPTGRVKLSEKETENQLNIIKKYYKLDFKRRTGVDYDTYVENPEVLDQKLKENSGEFWSIVDNQALQANYGNYPLD